MLQRSRDLVTGPLTLDYLVKRTAEGWQIAAVEWVREVQDAAQPEPSVSVEGEQIPYGLRLSQDGSQLEEHPVERTVLLLILENIVREKGITEIAMNLNTEGMRTRQGAAWSASAVFELLPRLIESGPSLLKSNDWQNLRNRKSAPN